VDDADVAVVGAGVVGCATALGLARRGAAVVLLEAHEDVALEASGTNSGILHTGFDSEPGELETELILRAAALRPALIEALGVPLERCGALVRPRDEGEREVVRGLAENARRNGVETTLRDDGALEVPGESVTDPVAFTLALAAAASRHGARLQMGFRVASLERRGSRFELASAGGTRVRSRLVVNCAGLYADEVARLAGDDSFEIYPRKGEFLVMRPPEGERLERILLPVPSQRTKGVLVFPTIGGELTAGPTAVDLEDKGDWSVRPEAKDEILAKAGALWEPLARAEPLTVYAGLRPAGRGVNYVIGPSQACPGLINVAAIRSTGLTASVGIAERVCSLVEEAGGELGPERELIPGPAPNAGRPWWRRTAEALAA
jgi:glycerol-3-phosphate dehydrogenase